MEQQLLRSKMVRACMRAVGARAWCVPSVLRTVVRTSGVATDVESKRCGVCSSYVARSTT